MTNIYQMRNCFELKEAHTAITRADFENHFTKTAESVRFTFNGWDGKSYDGKTPAPGSTVPTFPATRLLGL